MDKFTGQDWKEVKWNGGGGIKQEKKDIKPKYYKTTEQKIEEMAENGDLKQAKPDIAFKNALQQARQKLGLSQDKFAQGVNMPSKKINDFEGGKVIPTNGEICKIENKYKIKLPRPKKEKKKKEN